MEGGPRRPQAHGMCWRVSVNGGRGRTLSATVLAGLLLLAGAAVWAALPKGHRWLFVLGMAGSAGTAIALWIARGYEDFEGPPWIAAILLMVLYGGLWSLGAAIGFLFRLAVVAQAERRTWR
jgi:hypothetical protein